MPESDPFLSTQRRSHVDGPFDVSEVGLANRNCGILLEMLRHDVTPAGLHYLLNHFDVPYVPDDADWRLEIGGRVRTPLTLSLGEIKRLPARTLRVTMECAGNGRAAMSPRYPSMPWVHEAVGTAEWTGTPLRHLLERAGLLDDTVEVSFIGADRGVDRGVEHDYGRSLKPDMALGEDVLVAWAMNGAPLLPQHGFPLRLIVPGWYGMASVKWLARIEALDSPFQGYQQVGSYIYRSVPGGPGMPVTHIRVKSLMVPPGIPDFYTRRRLAPAGAITIHGRAWSGAGVPITGVELGVDGRWKDARVDAAVSPYAWCGWSAIWEAEPGEHELSCRATDANGDTQPVEAQWDAAGFGNNAVQRVRVKVT